MTVGRLKVWNYVTGAWEYVAPGLMGPTGPAGATGPAGGVGATGPIASPRTLTVTSPGSSYTPNANLYDTIYFVGGGTLTINKPSGTPVASQKLTLVFVPYMDTFNITWGTGFSTFSAALPPTTLTDGQLAYVGSSFRNVPGASSQWDIIAVQVA